MSATSNNESPTNLLRHLWKSNTRLLSTANCYRFAATCDVLRNSGHDNPLQPQWKNLNRQTGDRSNRSSLGRGKTGIGEVVTRSVSGKKHETKAKRKELYRDGTLMQMSDQRYINNDYQRNEERKQRGTFGTGWISRVLPSPLLCWFIAVDKTRTANITLAKIYSRLGAM